MLYMATGVGMHSWHGDTHSRLGLCRRGSQTGVPKRAGGVFCCEG